MRNALDDDGFEHAVVALADVVLMYKSRFQLVDQLALHHLVVAFERVEHGRADQQVGEGTYDER